MFSNHDVLADHMDAFWTYISQSQVHPALILLPYAVLPIAGVPIIPFLVLLGLRFGSAWGIVIMLAAMPIHLTVSFWFTRTVAGPWIKTLAEKVGATIPELPEKRQFGYGCLFMGIPGLSYALKNYLLPLSGIRFFPYLLCGWLIQGVMGVPFVIMGKALIQWDMKLMAVVGVIVLVFFLFKRKIGDMIRNQ
jgi:uncharacterized membrane protein YdjX (TVP38/TMEM64 family)